MRIVLIVIFALGWISFASWRSERDVAAAELDVQEVPIVAMFKENASRLISGRFVASGSFELQESKREMNGSSFEQEVNKFEYDEQVDCVFDFGHGSLSFMRRRLPIGNAPSMAGVTSGYIGTPESSLVVKSSDGSVDGWSVDVLDPFFPELGDRIAYRPIFDPRFVGLGGLFQLHGVYDDLVKKYFDSGEFKVSRDGANLYLLEKFTLTGKDGEGNLRQWWCDPSQGFQPVRRILRYWQSGDSFKAAQLNAESTIVEESRCRWVDRDGIWLPEFVDHIGRLSNRGFHLKLKFIWNDVNRQIPRSEFDWRSLNLPAGSGVSDHRLAGEVPVTLEVVGAHHETDFVGLYAGNGSFKLWSVVLCVSNSVLLGGAIGVAIKRGVKI